MSSGGTAAIDKTANTPGIYTLTVSGYGFTQAVRGFHVSFEIRSPGGLPSAWRFDAGGCQEGRLEVLTSSLSKSCPAIGALPSSSLQYTLGPSGQSALLEFDVLFQGLVPPNPATTYTIARIVFDHTNSTATGSGAGCEGIDAPVCLGLIGSEILFEDGSTGIDLLASPGYVRWNDPGNLTACSGATLRDVRVEEVFVHCSNGLTDPQYVELSLPLQALPIASDLRLRTRDRAGLVILDGIVAAPSGVPPPPSPASRWLLGTSEFATASGLLPDLVIPKPFDVVGGRIELYDGRPGGDVVQELRYGTGEAIAAPPPGWGIERTAQGTYHSTSLLTPTRWDGTSGPASINCPAPSGSGFRIREVGLQCRDGSTNGFFVEVESRIEGEWPGPLDLVVLGTGGSFVARVSGLFGASSEGVVTPGLRRWLIAGPTFTSSNSVEPDSRLAFPIETLQPLTFSLIGGPGFSLTFHTIELDPTQHLPLPPPGRSALVEEDGTITVADLPTPENSDGNVALLEDCFCPGPECGSGELEGVRLEEVLAGCAAADTTARFVELRAPLAGSSFTAHSRLDAYDRHGTLLFTLSDVFPGHAEGEPWPAGASWLLGSSEFVQRFGVTADHVLPPLDPLAGSLQFYDARAPHRLISELRYGPEEPIGRLDEGSSARRTPGGDWSREPIPRPETFSGASGLLADCPCPRARIQVGTDWIELADAVVDTIFGGSRYFFDRVQGRSYVSHEGTVEVTDRYVVRGLPVGTPLTIQAVLLCSGFVDMSCGPVHGCRPIGIAHATWRTDFAWQTLGLPEKAEAAPLTIPLEVVAGEPFLLGWGIDVALATYEIQLTFAGLPQGSWVESCMGFRTEPAVATRPALTHVLANADEVRLSWQGEELAGRSVEVERHDGAWSTRTVIIGDAQGGIRYVDPDVEGGRRYGYRLSWRLSEGVPRSTEETWVDVPVPAFAARLSSGPVVRGIFPLSLSLPSSHDLSIELVDLRGRRLDAHHWKPAASGEVNLEYRPARRLAPGVYWIRVTQGPGRATLRAIVLADGR